MSDEICQIITKSIDSLVEILGNEIFWSSLVALLIASGIGRYLKPLIGIKPRLVIVDDIEKFVQKENEYWRLAIKNAGKETARFVQVDVTSIIESGNKRTPYLSVPLNWTHVNEVARNIVHDQIAYLDVLTHDVANGGTNVRISTLHSGGNRKFDSLETGETELTLTFYLENGGSFDKKLSVSWNGQQEMEVKINEKK